MGLKPQEVIHKYRVGMEQDATKIMLPKRARLVHFGEDYQKHMCIWCQVDPGNDLEPVYFQILPTGVSFDPATMKHHCSTVLEDGTVWHLFEVEEA